MKSRTRGRDDIKVFMTDLRSADETAGGKAVSPPDRIEEHPQTGTPAANRTAQIRTATAIVPTNPSHSLYGAVSGIPPSNVSRIATPPFDLACPQCGNKVVKNMDRLTLPLKKRGV